ncbi:MAG: DUF2294 domain-containing protein [Chitinispirillaceae bacterium]|nr:DUF2294 domain-containing protein [Chitinispirillaceae bacterium]
MDSNQNNKDKNLREIIEFFVKEQLGLRPESIFIDTHGTSITVTLTNVLSEAEKNGAKDPQTGELIVKAMSESFRSIKDKLIEKCSSVLSKKIKNATFLIDTQSNYATILIITDNY